MKKIIIILLLSFSLTQLQAQKSYFACYNVEVSNDGVSDFATALDNFMMSDAGAKLPYSVILSEIFFGNADNKFSHQICFLAKNADVLADWGSKPPPTPEGILLQISFAKNVKVNQTILGSPLIETSSLMGDYFNIWQLNVEDVAVFASAFTKFSKDTEKMRGSGSFGLYEIIAGSNKNVTHHFGAYAANLGEFLKIREKIITSQKEFEAYDKSTAPISNVEGVFGGQIIKRYNMK